MEQFLLSSSSYKESTRGITGLKDRVTHLIEHQFEEHIDSNEHPSRFLCIYENNELLGYIQFGYFAPNGYKPFYYISNLKNISSRKGIGKKLMQAFTGKYKRIFLDDNAFISNKRANGYYEQFGFTQIPGLNIWQIGFGNEEVSSIALLYTRIISSEFRKVQE